MFGRTVKRDIYESEFNDIVNGSEDMYDDYEEEDYEIIEDFSSEENEDESFSSYSSHKGWGSSGYGRKSYYYGRGGYGYSRNTGYGYGYGYSTRNVYNSFKGLHDTVKDILKFLYIDLRLDDALPSVSEIEFISMDKKVLSGISSAAYTALNGKAVSTVYTQERDRLTVGLNAEEIRDISLNKKDIQFLIKSELAKFSHPIFNYMLSSSESYKKKRKMLEGIIVGAKSSKEGEKEKADYIMQAKDLVIWGLDEVKSHKYTHTLADFLEGMHTNLVFLTGMSVRDAVDVPLSGVKLVLDNAEFDETPFSDEELEFLKTFYNKMYEIVAEEESKDATQSKTVSYINFFLSLQADIIWFDEFSQDFDRSDIYKNLLEKPELKDNKIVKILRAHYFSEECNLYDRELLSEEASAPLLNYMLGKYSLEEFTKDLEKFKESDLFAMESNRFDLLNDVSDNTSGACSNAMKVAMNEAMNAMKETNSGAVSGSSERIDAIEEAKKEQEGEGQGQGQGDGNDGEGGSQSKECGGVGYGEGYGDIQKDLTRRLGEHAKPVPKPDVATAESYDLEELFESFEISSRWGYSVRDLIKRVYNKDYVIARDKIKKLFVHDAKHSIPSYAPTKRLNPKRFGMKVVSPSVSIYKKAGKPKPMLKSVNLIIDMSGSMSGAHEVGSMQLISIFSELAEMGVVKGNVIYSLPSGGAVYKLPMKKEDIVRFRAIFGSEGLQNTFTKSVDIIKRAEYNFFITDGNITDAPLDKNAIKAKGIYTTGLYIGRPQQSEILLEWFEKGICRETLTELADEMVNKLKN